ncbi:MAG: hypothetical protein WAV72_18280 [Bradyrhizobium sp.]
MDKPASFAKCRRENLANIDIIPSLFRTHPTSGRASSRDLPGRNLVEIERDCNRRFGNHESDALQETQGAIVRRGTAPGTGEPIHPKGSALAEYPVKVEDGIVYIDTEGVSPLFASP